MNNKKRTYPITMLSEGETAKIENIQGCENARKKLTDLGIIPGKIIQVISGMGNGPRVVKVGETKIMIGKGMFMKIFISLDDE